ncbi:MULTISPECIES: efflux transporter outer membrane subunit [Pseudoalteromonas]|uniref:Efflux transporter outer membrane subunit n=1 Tax=Pseudoalteromonas fuliginea TaxID=1872678 RepID=A0ABQ6RMZ2_9GAMM|nr:MULTISPECIES: efflux transporter outer membrane subunit [Pseudoalteromonas]ALQ10148.1 multidrug transporter [Pseudoalteromonas sp. Bsw20308]KAA1164798.1 efflux transporter outer membrane subunit [Pseudoalteromonas fuliginea]KAA1169405.1 efflux transporter outer membrane subunit [Pseudoalteromonas fuliginea]GAA78312.1 outer membrane protein oprM [Pseudoalteromonas sp. BSi20495]
MSIKTFSLSAIALLVLSGCQLAPEQKDLVLPVSDAYASDTAQSAAQQLNWQQFFNDEKLQTLISQSLEHNKDMQIAVLNVQRVRGLYQIEDSALYPSLDLNASGTRQRLPADLAGTGDATISSQYSATVGITSYELDIWGKVRNQSAQALQNLYSTELSQYSTQVSLISELANAWLNYATDLQLLELAKETLTSQQESLSLTQKSFDLGAASSITLEQLRSTVATAKVDIATYKRLLKRDKSALDLLVGKSVSADLLPNKDLTNLISMPEVPVGLPSDLLSQRPDIKAAEHLMLAANANIGIARAAFYPSISLTANAGSASSDLSGLFDSGSGTWSFVPSISLPIFNMGRNQANLDVAKADQEIAVATYQQKIQNAFREVADALADREGYQEQLSALDMLISSRQITFDLSKMRYEKGADSYLQVLDAQRTWYGAQQQLIAGQQAYLASQINLYKALGGGWNVTSEITQEEK